LASILVGGFHSLLGSYYNHQLEYQALSDVDRHAFGTGF